MVTGPTPVPGLQLNYLTGLIITAAMKVHSALRPGLESAHEACLPHELRKQGLEAESQVLLPVICDGVTIDPGYRTDLLVEDSVVVELECVEAFNPIHDAQLLSYLKLSGKHIGLLINFSHGTPQTRHPAIGKWKRLGKMKIISPVVLCARCS